MTAVGRGGWLRIPRIGVDLAFSDRIGELDRGPAVHPMSAWPGEGGHTVIVGHRSTFGSPFADLDLLVPGNAITLETAAGVCHYMVTGSRITTRKLEGVLTPTRSTSRLPTLSLAACHPKGAQHQRIVVDARTTSDRGVRYLAVGVHRG